MQQSTKLWYDDCTYYNQSIWNINSCSYATFYCSGKILFVSNGASKDTFSQGIWWSLDCQEIAKDILSDSKFLFGDNIHRKSNQQQWNNTSYNCKINYNTDSKTFYTF